VLSNRREEEDTKMGHDSDLVTIFETGNAALIAMAKSLLDGADIAYFVKNENLQNLFGGGVMGTGFNVVVGPVQIQVRREDQDTARTLLSDLGEGFSAAT
jgi:hypothetical protein